MSESAARVAGLVTLTALMLTFSYLFYGKGGITLSLILLFIGIVLALLSATSLSSSVASSKRRR
jgi:hypothetical protein